MSIYSVIKSLSNKEKKIKARDITPLGVGAAIGGIFGSYLFVFIKSRVFNSNIVGVIQSICLMIIGMGVVLYIILKKRITTYNISGDIKCASIGMMLGVISSFLGIGGGPINMVVLFFFFSMESNVATINSLYIIFISKITNILYTIITQNIPEFEILSLIFILTGAIFGSFAGRVINKRINNPDIDKLIICLMIVIIVISGYNVWQYSNVLS